MLIFLTYRVIMLQLHAVLMVKDSDGLEFSSLHVGDNGEVAIESVGAEHVAAAALEAVVFLVKSEELGASQKLGTS